MDELPPRLPAPRPPAERLRDWITWFGTGRLVAIAVSVVLIGAGGYWLVAPPPAPVELSLPSAVSSGSTVAGSSGDVPPGAADGVASVVPPDASSTGAADAPTTSAAPVEVPADLIVHVAGAVLAPGLHRVPPGARVADAVAAAGGAAPDAHTDAVNLAAPLRDGDRVYVPRLDDGVTVPVGVSGSPAPSAGAAPAAGASTTGGAPPGPVSLNSATTDQFDALPGVGPATAAAIVAHREQHGPFRSVDGLADVRGIGPAKLEQLRPLVTL